MFLISSAVFAPVSQFPASIGTKITVSFLEDPAEMFEVGRCLLPKYHVIPGLRLMNSR